LPFLAAVLASARGENVQRYSAAVALVAGAALVIVIGIALNQSIAGYGLGIAVLAASALIILPRRNAARTWIALGSAALLLGAVTLLVTSPVGDRELGASRSLNSRVSITTTTAHAIGELMPFGSGLGTFKAVYRLYEDHDRLNRISVNHAHNDYLELALEMGVAGVILMALVLAWWAVAVWRAWRSGDAGPYARAASIASAAILVHSLVDFPLRTAAISTAFAMCLALLVERTTRSPDRSDLWPTRHVVLR
jgi:O-antigen ligase